MGKVSVITGASRGIGAVLAKRLAKHGYQVVVAARDEAALAQVVAAIGTAAHAVVTDVTKREDHAHLRSEALRVFGAVDLWINNAGQGIGRPVLELTDADFDAMMLINTKSALYGMQTIIPHFKSTGHGHLINISSFLARVPMASARSAYSAAKAALNSLTTNLRLDLAQAYPGIHVSTVMPAMVDTEFSQRVVGEAGASQAPSAVPAQTPEQVVEAIVRLIDHPRGEIYTNPGSPGAAQRFFEGIGAFQPLERER